MTNKPLNDMIYQNKELFKLITNKGGLCLLEYYNSYNKIKGQDELVTLALDFILKNLIPIIYLHGNFLFYLIVAIAILTFIKKYAIMNTQEKFT